MAPASRSTSSPLNYEELHVALKSDSLVGIVISKIPKLTGFGDFDVWSDTVILVLQYCRIDKILTGEWAEPTVTQGDVFSKRNAEAWRSLDTWIMIILNLSDEPCRRVRHLNTSHKRWKELKDAYYVEDY